MAERKRGFEWWKAKYGDLWGRVLDAEVPEATRDLPAPPRLGNGPRLLAGLFDLLLLFATGLTGVAWVKKRFHRRS